MGAGSVKEKRRVTLKKECDFSRLDHIFIFLFIFCWHCCSSIQVLSMVSCRSVNESIIVIFYLAIAVWEGHEWRWISKTCPHSRPNIPRKHQHQHDVTHASVSVFAVVVNLNSTCRMHTEADIPLIERASSFALPCRLLTKSLWHILLLPSCQTFSWILVQILQWCVFRLNILLY